MKKVHALALTFGVAATLVALVRLTAIHPVQAPIPPQNRPLAAARLHASPAEATEPRQTEAEKTAAPRDHRPGPEAVSLVSQPESAPSEREPDAHSPFRKMAERREREHENFLKNFLNLEPAQREELQELLARRIAARLDRAEGRLSNETLQGDLAHLDRRIQDLIGDNKAALLNEFTEKQSVERGQEMVSLIPATEGVKHEFKAARSLPSGID